MGVKRPSRPSGVTRTRKPTRTADPMNTPMDRSTAQKLRTDRTLSYSSMAARAMFWSKQQKQLEQYDEEIIEQSYDEMSQGSLADMGTGFAGANIAGATLQSEPPPSQPSIDEQASIAGLGDGGIAPPPPPH